MMVLDFRIWIGLCFEQNFRIRIGFGYYWNFSEWIGLSNFNIRITLVVTQHPLRNCVDHLLSSSFPHICNTTSWTWTVTKLIWLLRGIDLITFRFLQCPGVLALIYVFLLNIDYRQIKSTQLPMLEVQPYAGGTDVLPQVSWQKSLGSQKKFIRSEKNN